MYNGRRRRRRRAQRKEEEEVRNKERKREEVGKERAQRMLASEAEVCCFVLFLFWTF
jgi:hypothetical protein